MPGQEPERSLQKQAEPGPLEVVQTPFGGLARTPTSPFTSAAPVAACASGQAVAPRQRQGVRRRTEGQSPGWSSSVQESREQGVANSSPDPAGGDPGNIRGHTAAHPRDRQSLRTVAALRDRHCPVRLAAKIAARRDARSRGQPPDQRHTRGAVDRTRTRPRAVAPCDGPSVPADDSGWSL